MTKKTLGIDMDGVIANFDKAIKSFEPDLHTSDEYPDFESRAARVNAICEANPFIFRTLELMEGAVEFVEQMDKIFDIYFVSTPMWNVPESFTDKRYWLERYFGEMAYKKLILTHRKDLIDVDFLVDDRLRNGVENFKGEHIHFGQGKFQKLSDVSRYLGNFYRNIESQQY